MPELHAGERDRHAGGVERHAGRHDVQHAEAPDQVAREEARREHADHMPFEHEGRVPEGVPAHLHGQRRGRHQQIHHPVAQRCPQHRDREYRIAQQLRHRAARGGAGRRRRWNGRKADACHAGHGHQGHHEQCQVGPGEGNGEQVACVVGQVGAGYRAQQAAGHHQRHGRVPLRRGRDLGRGEAVELAVGTVVARHERGSAQQPERVHPHGQRAEQGRRRRHCQPDLEGGLPPPAPLGPGHGTGGQRSAHHVAHHRQGGHPAARRELQAHQPVDGDEDDVVGEEQPLAEGEQAQRAAVGGGHGRILQASMVSGSSASSTVRLRPPCLAA